MTNFRLMGAALVLSVATATSAFAQAAIQEPGAYAFYHPNGDVLHAGSAQPAANAFAAFRADTDTVRARSHHRARRAHSRGAY
jgi:hypothetical protein